MMQPVTEQSNELTKNIDIASPSEMVKLLHEADKQMFLETTGLLSRRTLQTVEDIVDVATRLLQTGDSNLIVMSGCGTSGRIAFQTFRTLNRLLQQTGKQNHVDYLIAGSDRALSESRENVEDNPHVGRTDLQAITSGKAKILFVGITCGLSAPYVAGQLDFCMEHLDRFIPVLVGFNPVAAARDLPIESWDKTFLQIAWRLEKLHEENKGFVLNPIIGPEPITGSTRMKGGSATKILLLTIFMTALARHQRVSLSITDQLQEYIEEDDMVYSDVTQLASIVQHAGHSLRCEGHVYYVAANESLALCGLIDASECKPTYGASIEDVRSFIVGGYQRLDNKAGDLSSQFPVSNEYFDSEIVPRLTSSDLVILLATDEELQWVGDAILNCSAVKVLVNFVTSEQHVSASLSDSMSVIHNVRLPSALVTSLRCQSVAIGDAMMTSLLELACKLTCNVITTCGYILYGKVYENYMIDVAVSNNKLYHRAVNIVRKFGECSEKEAVDALLKCIYDTDSVSSELLDNSISQHLRSALKRRQVVPTAILLVKLRCSQDVCRHVLSQHAIVREALAHATAFNTESP